MVPGVLLSAVMNSAMLQCRKPEPTSTAQNGWPAPASEDHALLGRMASGDPSGLGELYDRWCPRLYPVVFWLVGNEADAEEVMESTFWYVWRNCGKRDFSEGSVEAWLIGLTLSEIARRSGQPQGTIQAQLRLALEQVRDGVPHLRGGAAARD